MAKLRELNVRVSAEWLKAWDALEPETPVEIATRDLINAFRQTGGSDVDAFALFDAIREEINPPTDQEWWRLRV